MISLLQLQAELDVKCEHKENVCFEKYY